MLAIKIDDRDEDDRIEREAAAERMATLAQVDREEADRMDLQFDIDSAAAAARVVLVVEDVPAPAAVTSVPPELADAADQMRLDLDFLDGLAFNSNLDPVALIDRLESIDFAAARAALAA